MNIGSVGGQRLHDLRHRLLDLLLQCQRPRLCGTGTNRSERRSLCRCAWNRIVQTPGERSALLQEALQPGTPASNRAHWLAIEHRQIRSCVSETHLTGALWQAELKYPKLAQWMQQR